MTVQFQIDSFADFEKATTALMRGPFVSRYGRVRWRDLDAPGPEHEYIIDGFLTVGDKSIIGGPSMSGKSFFAIHAGMSIALGTSFFGHAVLRRALVIYQAGEGARGIKKRLRAYRQHFDVPHDADVPFELLTSKIDLYHADADTPKLVDEILGISSEYPDLQIVVFIDTLATAQGGADENSGKDMGAIMANIDRIEKATGAHVCLVHHMNADGTKLRGHTSILANIDQVITVKRDEATKIRTAALSKQKDDEDGLTIRFELMSIEIGQRPDGKPITSCVCLPVGEKEEIRSQSNAWTPNPTERRVVTQLFEALKRHGIAATLKHSNDYGIPIGTQIVEWSHYRSVVRSLAVADEQDEKRSADAIRKEFERTYPKLKEANILGLAKPFMWWAGRPVKGFPDTYKRGERARQPPTSGVGGVDAPDNASSEALDDLGF